MSCKWETIIGLEIHLQLKTRSKIFCSCSTDFSAPANTNTCPICLGWPGSMPALNQKAVLLALRGAVALNCKINRESSFDRKNYFYPDLPKGFQITQYFRPLGFEGFFQVGENKVGIQRVHLEEDAGKTIYNGEEVEIDYNRAGIPLVEIVTEPDLVSPDQARDFLRELRLLLLYLGISDCNMEEGSLRCDANISISTGGEKTGENQVELKNLNSFQAIARALEYEQNRQKALKKGGEEIARETRGWDTTEEKTFLLRSKEESVDYRYFPEPDLPVLVLEEGLIDSVRMDLPEKPQERKKRWEREWKIEKEETEVLISQQARADFFEKTARLAPPREAAKWIKENLVNFDFPPEISPEELGDIINRVRAGELSTSRGKDVLQLCLESGKNPARIIQEKGWTQVSDEDYIEKLVDRVLEENPGVVDDYLSGKDKAIRFLIGQAMKLSQGQANPGLVWDLMERKLEERKNYG